MKRAAFALMLIASCAPCAVAATSWDKAFSQTSARVEGSRTTITTKIISGFTFDYYDLVDFETAKVCDDATKRNAIEHGASFRQEYRQDGRAFGFDISCEAAQ